MEEDVSMLCTIETCRGETQVVRSLAPTHPKLPLELQGLNVTRRRRECLTCGYRFITIEMAETEFDKLRKPPTLERPVQPIRPLKGD